MVMTAKNQLHAHIQLIELDDFHQVRLDLLSLLNHRRRTLNMKPYFEGKAMRMKIVEDQIKKFENLTACTEEVFWAHVKKESAYFIFLYSQTSRYVQQRQKLMLIASKSLNY